MRRAGAGAVLVEALRLGCTSFGGPIAHLGYFEKTYVRRLQWLSAADYAGLAGLCQLLPGPASSQVGFLVGLRRAGWLGALAAWLGFTLPSALLMVAFAWLAPHLPETLLAPVLHGLQLVAVAVVAQAVWSMAQRLCADRQTAVIGACSAIALLLYRAPLTQLITLLAGALLGMLACRRSEAPMKLPAPVSTRVAAAALTVFLCLLLLLPLAAVLFPHGLVALLERFYRAGALVFGGGHVVLPLLRDGLVPSGWVSDAAFLAGYGAAQALPGPLFAFAAYLGAVAVPPGGGFFAAALALTAVFVPGLLLAIAGLRAFQWIESMPRALGALAGINAAVVGMLGAALYDPVWTSAVADAGDALVAASGFVLLQRWKVAPLAIVVSCVTVALLRQVLH